jgi:hypothetical protein
VHGVEQFNQTQLTGTVAMRLHRDCSRPQAQSDIVTVITLSMLDTAAGCPGPADVDAKARSPRTPNGTDLVDGGDLCATDPKPAGQSRDVRARPVADTRRTRSVSVQVGNGLSLHH